MSRPAKAGATDEVRPPRRRLCARLSSTPKAGGFTAAAASADRAMRAGRVPRMPRWLRQPRHGSRAWYCPCTLASGSDPRHESRVALLADKTGELSHDALDALGQPTDDVARRLDPIDQAGGLACQEGHGRDVARRIHRRRHRPESPYRDALAGERRFADHRLMRSTVPSAPRRSAARCRGGRRGASAAHVLASACATEAHAQRRALDLARRRPRQ